MTPRPLLDSIHSPADLRRLPESELPALAAEIRAELVEVVSRTGGHLGPNLGAVELTIALLRVFDPPADTIVWDTGHQAYVHKLLTGRRALFQNLRQSDGCCGFQHRQESTCDAFGAGHAGTAISAALGFAAARDQAGGNGRVVAVVGDGALGCGVSLEGINNIVETTKDFILVLNDNKMSIAPNVGAVAHYLSRVISAESYNRFRDGVAHFIARIPHIGPPARKAIHRIEEMTKGVLVHGTLFEELGLRYIGPVDGHDLPGLVRTFQNLRRLRQPIVLHVLTRKGQGYAPAEAAPETFHGIGPFNPATGTACIDKAGGASFSAALGNALCDEVGKNRQVLAITAGMCSGTGLKPLREKFPDHLRDVGIAEEHAVVFAAGLAAAGYRPVVAIYASFMQRAMDCVFHDVCLQNLPVVFCLDRAGYVEDGPTHSGIHDLGFWRTLPNLAVLQPSDDAELRGMLSLLIARNGPGMLRYPRGGASALPVQTRTPLEWGKAELLREGPDVAIWAAGRETLLALEVADLLAVRGIRATVVNPRFLQPFDSELFLRHAAAMPVVTLENHVLSGGLAGIAADLLLQAPRHRGILRRGWPADTVLPWGPEADLRRRFRLDAASLAEDIAAFLQNPVE